MTKNQPRARFVVVGFTDLGIIGPWGAYGGTPFKTATAATVAATELEQLHEQRYTFRVLQIEPLSKAFEAAGARRSRARKKVLGLVRGQGGPAEGAAAGRAVAQRLQHPVVSGAADWDAAHAPVAGTDRTVAAPVVAAVQGKRRAGKRKRFSDAVDHLNESHRREAATKANGGNSKC